MRWLPWLLVAATSAAADPAQPVRVTGKLDGTTARFTARYALAVKGGEWNDEHSELAVPRFGLVTAGRATIGTDSHELALLGAQEAAERFTALREESTRGAKTSAVIVEGDTHGVNIGVASARSGTLFVDLEIAVPTCYFQDQRYVAVPANWRAIVGATRASRARAAQLQHACGYIDDELAWAGFASRDLAKLPSGARVGVSSDRIELGDTTIARVEIDLASALGDVPRDLATVLVVDTSRSLDAYELTTQRAVVADYLKRAPSSRVQVVTFARGARPLLTAWTTAATAAPTIAKTLLSMKQENGSNVDAGLAEAATWLNKIRGTRRVVLITDERMAQRLASMSADALKQLLPPGTLVHVAVPAARPGTFERDDTDKLGRLATATEGMRLRIGVTEPVRALDVSALVRQTSLDDLKIVAPAWSLLPASNGRACQQEEHDLHLGEGQACTWWATSKTAGAQPITVEGKLWGKTFKQVLPSTPVHPLDFAREVSTIPMLDRPQADLVAEKARAVNAHHSLYAAWGGAGTYQQLAEGRLGVGKAGAGYPTPAYENLLGTGRIGTIGTQQDLAVQLASTLQACNLGSERVEVRVEFTVREIADVQVTAKTRAHAHCVTEAIWAATPRFDYLIASQVVSFVAGG